MSISDDRHTVSAFDQDLDQLRNLVARMATLADEAIGAAMAALATQDVEQADGVIARDIQVDALQHELERQIVRLIALRAPMADDLRNAVAALKIASGVERIADYAKTIAKRVKSIAEVDTLDTTAILPRMAATVSAMARDATAAYLAHDAGAAEAVRRRDEEADALYRELFLALVGRMMNDPGTVQSATALLFVAKSLERIGDHATNVAENVYFAVTGEQMSDRPEAI